MYFRCFWSINWWSLEMSTIFEPVELSYVNFKDILVDGREDANFARRNSDYSVSYLTYTITKAHCHLNKHWLTPCCPVNVNQYFRAAYCFHVQGSRMCQPRYQYEAGSKHRSAWLILWPWGWCHVVPPETPLTFNRLHRFISQKVELFIHYNFGTNQVENTVLLLLRAYSFYRAVA
jgi:hypothetical protein